MRLPGHEDCDGGLETLQDPELELGEARDPFQRFLQLEVKKDLKQV